MFAVQAQEQNKFEALMQDLKSVPSMYYTSEAYSYYTRSGQSIPPQPPRETITKGYRAAIRLGEMGSEASAATSWLVENFPVMIHITEIRNAQYAGEGTFEDWLMTYLTSEKNKFILSSPVLDYNSMSVCEGCVTSSHETEFIDKKYGSSGAITRATVNVTITLKLFVGACALGKITGTTIGNEQQAWKDWYLANGGVAPSSGISSIPQNNSAPAEAGAYVPPVKSPEDVILKATYRVTLTTGDELTGVVESKNDTGLILETTDGKPYIFRYSLIKQYELLKRPQVIVKTNNGDRMQLTWEELQTVSDENLFLEVIIAGGTTFKGTLASIDQSMLRINVEGSKIPITKEAVRKIMVVPNKEKTENVDVKKPSLQGPLDTILVRNPQVDDWGVRGADIKLIGQVQSQNDQNIVLKLLDESTRVINRADVIRVFLNSSNANKVEDPIKTYAQPLFCPADMFLVDMPPGKKGKPFFKVCVDRYEYPNKKDQVPVASVSFLDAKKYCESQGKRLCTAEEWEWACAGLEGYQYPYGFNREENKCNSDTRQIEPSGARLNCVGKFGGYDMTGNIFEWVVGKNNEPAMMGGPYSKCQTVSPGLDGSAKPQTGLRCCKR
jgi:hypothetical protein